MNESKPSERTSRSRAHRKRELANNPVRLEDPDGIQSAALKALPGRVEYQGESGYVYIAQLSDGTTKIGFSENVRQRIREHAANGRMFGLGLVAVWVSPVHASAKENEHLLLGYARRTGRAGMRPEYFTAVDFGEAVAFAQRLKFEPVDVERIQ